MTDHNCPDFCKHRAQEAFMDRQDVMDDGNLLDRAYHRERVYNAKLRKELDDGLPAKCCGRCRHLDLEAYRPLPGDKGWCCDHGVRVPVDDYCLAFELREF